MNTTNRERVPVRVPWWGRLEVRVIAALVLLGTMCIGASLYLVRLSVSYFDARLATALEEGQSAVQAAEPFHRDLVQAQIQAFEARARAIGLELLAADLGGDPRTDEERLAAILQREPDLVALLLERPDGRTSEQGRLDVYPEDKFEWFEITTPLETSGAERRRTGLVRVVFRIDPEIDERFQALGRQKRALGLAQSSRTEIERAVTNVVVSASLVVLLVSVVAGLVLARTMTRKASELSRVMAVVGRGDLTVRARERGRDELGQLAGAFNRMLDELGAAQRKVAYLQRIGAWQDMARRIAHEIKNPLTPIQLAVQQIREKDPHLSAEYTKMLRTSVEIIEDEIAGLRRMVTAFSQFSKVPEVRLEKVGLRRVLEEFQRAYGHLTDDESDILRVDLPSDEVLIEGDRQLLKQSLVNLVENAVLSAREAGRSPVEVAVGAEVGGTVVILTIDDNGPGIPTERKEQVFEPYQTTREEGTGLGLAIVKKIVLDHGGEVWVEDSPLGGARFVIRLRRAAPR